MCFTSFLDIPPVFTEQMSYLCYSPEICPTTGRPHFQGYVYWRDATTIQGAVNRIPHVSFQVALGSPYENMIYCGKENYEKDGKIKEANPNFVEFGKPPKGAGHRTDRETVIDMLSTQDRPTLNRLVETCSVQQLRLAEYWLKYHEPCRTWKSQVYWIWGPSGSGKTSLAKLMCKKPENEIYFVDNVQYWEGYDGHEVVIIDDIRKADWEFNKLLRILGDGKYTVNVKGGSRQLLAKEIYITNCHPHDFVFHDTPSEPIKQLTRRISQEISITPEMSERIIAKKISLDISEKVELKNPMDFI